MSVPIKDQQVTTSLPKTLVFFGQWWGYRTAYAHVGKTYTHVLVRRPQELDFTNNVEYIETLDYDLSTNITATSKTEVIADTDFITTATFLQPLVISGKCNAVVNLSCIGDDIYTTFIDSCRITILKRDLSGTETQLSQEEYPQVANQPLVSHQFSYYNQPTTFTSYQNITETPIAVGEAIILRVEVFGHSSNAGASANKIKLHFARGHVDTMLIVSVVEDS